MPELPAVGTRVSLRYRRPAGSVPPLTDVVGHLLAVTPTVRVRDKRGNVVDVDAADVVAVKALGAAPVRTADIRNLEHAAALAWPGVAHEWLGGWFARFGHGSTRRANSAVPLGVSSPGGLDAVVRWYAARGAPPLLAVPDRLFRVPAGTPADGENLVLTGDLVATTERDVALAGRPSGEWLRLYERDVPVDVLSAVVDGEVVFATVPGAAVGRGAVTSAPDGTRWLGLSALHVIPAARGRGHARAVCGGLLAWGAERGADRAYVQVLADNAAAIALFTSMGFAEHHRCRYATVG